MAIINDRIREFRIARKMSLEELAQQIGVSRQTVFKYEHGLVADIPFSRIQLLAKALDTTPLFLMGLEDQVKRISKYLPLFDCDTYILDYPSGKPAGIEAYEDMANMLEGHERYVNENIDKISKAVKRNSEFAQFFYELVDAFEQSYYELRMIDIAYIIAELNSDGVAYLLKQAEFAAKQDEYKKSDLSELVES